MTKLELINKIVSDKKYVILRDALRNDFVRSDNPEGFNELNKEKKKELRHQITLVLHHLDFVSEYGDKLEKVKIEESKMKYAHHEVFDEWLNAGAKGLMDDTLKEIEKNYI